MLSIVLALALAQPISSTPCKTGGNCSLRSLVVGSGANRFLVGSTTGPFGTTLPGFKYSSASTQIGIFNANNASLFTLNLGTGLLNGTSLSLAGYLEFSSGTSGYLSWVGASAPTNLPAAAAVRGFYADNATNRVWRADTARWTEVGGAPHPVTERTTYLIVSDRTAGANPPAWAVAPRAGAASVAFTTVGTLSNSTGPGTEPWTNYQTTAVSGNQAHHSSAAWFSPGNRMSSRVGPGGVITSLRLFHGMSGTRPLAAGSATPTAHAAVFRFDTSAGDTNWMACTGAGVAITCTSTGVPVVANSDLNATLEIDCREASALGIPTACTFWVDGIPRVRVTTNLPAALMGHTHSVETLSAAARDFRFGSIAVETR